MEHAKMTLRSLIEAVEEVHAALVGHKRSLNA